MRGGAFVGSPVTDLLASSRNNSALYSGEPTNEGDALGFRISQIPVVNTFTAHLLSLPSGR